MFAVVAFDGERLAEKSKRTIPRHTSLYPAAPHPEYLLR